MEKKKEADGEKKDAGGKEERGMDDIRRNEHTNMPAYNDGEMDGEKDGEKDALAELAHTEQRKRPN